MIESSIEIGAEIFFGLVKKAYSGLTGYAQERDFFKTATRKYIKNLRDDFGEVRVLGMKERVPLESLYVRANVLEKLRVRSGDLPEEMEQNREMFLSAFGRTLETVDGEEIINKNENLIVLGKPGAGKTTYLKYLTLRMTAKDKGSKIKQRRLPIFIILHEFAKSGKSLLDYMAEQFRLCGFDDAKSFIERMLNNGDCIVLLDGLDEVSRDTHLDEVIQEVTDFTRQYRESRFIVSCRVAAYNHWFSKFKEVEIADFNKAQIEDFVSKYFQKEPFTGKECWKKLQESQSLLEMASSPLLLTLLCITYTERHNFQLNRVHLYDDAIKALCSKWDQERFITRQKQNKELTQNQIIKLVSRLAAGCFEANTYFIREEELCKMIEKYMINSFGEDYENKGASVLQDLEEYYSLIVRYSRYSLSFSHLTFMEYFTAQYIADNAMSGSVNGLIESHFWDDRWQEVFILTAGKLGHGAEAYLLWIQIKNRELLHEAPDLQALLLAIQVSIQSTGNRYPREVRQTVSAFIALSRDLHLTSYIDLELALARELILTQTIILTRDITNDPLRDLPSEFTLVRDLILARDRDLDVALDFDIVSGFVVDFGLYLDPLEFYGQLLNSFSEQSINKIKTYFKGNHLIIKCLNSGATVSAKVREQLLTNLFRPEGE